MDFADESIFIWLPFALNLSKGAVEDDHTRNIPCCLS